MPVPVTVLVSPEAVGEHVAAVVYQRMAEAFAAGRGFLLGSPTGRSPRPVYAALARRLAAQPIDLSRLTLVMMDEYLVPGPRGLAYAPAEARWSCHHFVGTEIVPVLDAAVPAPYRVRPDAVWFPDPGDPAAYDDRIASAGGVDLFMLASGASDGHVAFNPPGSARDSRTRIISLSEETRRDNLLTFPAFGTLDAVPHHGISVGIDTLLRSRELVMVAWGAGKRTTVARMRAARTHEPDWPATLVHAGGAGSIVVDEAAAG